MIAKHRHRGNGQQEASFEVLEGDRSRVIGSLHFTTVSALFAAGVAAINGGRAAVIDLAAVTASDSSGLALLIEWLSVAKGASRALRFDNAPSQILQLARLSEVEDLLVSPSLHRPAGGGVAGGGTEGAGAAEGEGLFDSGLSASGSSSGSSVTFPSDTR